MKDGPGMKFNPYPYPPEYAGKATALLTSLWLLEGTPSATSKGTWPDQKSGPDITSPGSLTPFPPTQTSQTDSTPGTGINLRGRHLWEL